MRKERESGWLKVSAGMRTALAAEPSSPIQTSRCEPTEASKDPTA
jgi:hypothetical protein